MKVKMEEKSLPIIKARFEYGKEEVVMIFKPTITVYGEFSIEADALSQFKDFIDSKPNIETGEGRIVPWHQVKAVYWVRCGERKFLITWEKSFLSEWRKESCQVVEDVYE